LFDVLGFCVSGRHNLQREKNNKRKKTNKKTKKNPKNPKKTKKEKNGSRTSFFFVCVIASCLTNNNQVLHSFKSLFYGQCKKVRVLYFIVDT